MFRQRKFTLALLFTLSTIAALFTGHLDGGQFIAVQSSIMGIYGVSNVADKQVQK